MNKGLLQGLGADLSPRQTFQYERYIGGTLTMNSTSWANLPTIGTLVLDAVVGDIIEAGLTTRVESQVPSLFLDVVSEVAGVPITSFGTGGAAPTSTTGDGVGGWICSGSVTEDIGGPSFLTVAAVDLLDGQIRVRFRYRTSTASNRTMVASVNRGLFFYALNRG